MVAMLAALIGLRASDSVSPLPEAGMSGSLAEIRTIEEPQDPPKRSPRPIEGSSSLFPWKTDGLGRTDPSDPLMARFHVYSQERKETNDTAGQVTRMLLRIWQQAKKRWRLDNPPQYNGGAIDVYLCKGGQPGGEQYFGVDYPAKGPGWPVSVICIYELKSFTKPLEMAREVAHEYGHAILPAVGGFVQPEDWANGYLGEKLFLRWMRDVMAKRELEPADAMQLDFSALDGYVRLRIDPLVVSAASNSPNLALLHKTGAVAMTAYHSLVLYADTILPKSVAARSMQLIGSIHAWDYPHSIVMACQELDRFALLIPPYLRGRPLWIPLGKGKVAGARVLRRAGEWAEIQPGSGAVVMIPASPGT